MKNTEHPTLSSKADIRHHLSIDRTIMANERTLLAYSRTGLTLVVSGLGFIHFADSLILSIISVMFIPIGLVTFIFGIFRFYKKRKSINEQRNNLGTLL